MVELSKLHLGEQSARGLLAPLRAELEALERRTARQATRLKLSADDQTKLETALRAVTTAREQVGTLWEAAQPPQSR